MVGEETAHKYRTTLYLAASASAELIADVLLCPWEAIKVRMQTTIPPFARGTLEGWNKITSTEGMAGYRSIYPFFAFYPFCVYLLFLFGCSRLLLFYFFEFAFFAMLFPRSLYASIPPSTHFCPLTPYHSLIIISLSTVTLYPVSLAPL